MRYAHVGTLTIGEDNPVLVTSPTGKKDRRFVFLSYKRKNGKFSTGRIFLVIVKTETRDKKYPFCSNAFLYFLSDFYIF